MDDLTSHGERSHDESSGKEKKKKIEATMDAGFSTSTQKVSRSNCRRKIERPVRIKDGALGQVISLNKQPAEVDAISYSTSSIVQLQLSKSFDPDISKSSQESSGKGKEKATDDLDIIKSSKNSQISYDENKIIKKRKVNYISSEDEYDDSTDDVEINEGLSSGQFPSSQGIPSLDKAQLLLMKKGKKLHDILLNPLSNQNSFTISIESRNEISNALVELTARTIKIVNIESAVKRIQQWKSQELQCMNFQVAIESYNLLHLISLIQIYEDLTMVGNELKADPKYGIKKVKDWVINFARSQLNIGTKKEQRYRLGCNRLQKLFDRGITSDQLVQAGCRRSDFFAKQKNYDIFLSQISD